MASSVMLLCQLSRRGILAVHSISSRNSGPIYGKLKTLKSDQYRPFSGCLDSETFLKNSIGSVTSAKKFPAPTCVPQAKMHAPQTEKVCNRTKLLTTSIHSRCHPNALRGCTYFASCRYFSDSGPRNAPVRKENKYLENEQTTKADDEDIGSKHIGQSPFKNLDKHGNDMKENIATIPNILSTSRMVLSPVLGYMVLQEAYPAACGIFIAAGITDLLDGWIARNYPSQRSALGSVIDPLADKLLVSILYITLTMVHLIPVPLTAMILIKDFGLILGGFYLRYISLPPPKTLSRYFDVSLASANVHPLFISKLNTTFQLMLVALTLAAPVFNYVDHICLQALWYVTATTTFASAVGYLFAKDTVSFIKPPSKK